MAECKNPVQSYYCLASRRLYKSIHNGATKKVKSLLQQQLLDVNKPFENDVFLLFPSEIPSCIMIADCGEFAWILNDKIHGYSVSITPLSAAAAYSQFSIMNMLLKAGADINKKCTYGITVKNGKANKWMQGLQGRYYFEDSTLLHHACYEHNAKLVKYLVDNGANINELDNDERTPLHLAVSKYNISQSLWIVRYLLQHGANVNARNCYELTPLYAVMDKYRCHIYQDGEPEDLFSAAENMFQHLQSHGADLCVQSHFGQSVLHYYAICKDHHFLQAVLPHCDAQQTEYKGESLLHVVCCMDDWSEKHAVIRQVLPYSDVNQTDHNGWTPLFVCGKGDLNGILLLLEHGADARHTDKWGFTALAWTVDERMVDILYRHGCEDRYSRYYVSIDQFRQAYKRYVFNLVSRNLYVTDIPQHRHVSSSQHDIHQLITQSCTGFFNDRSHEQMEAAKIANSICQLMTLVAGRMGDVDPALAVRGIQLSGSVGERTKVHQPDEFDFVLEFEELPKWLRIPDKREHEYSFTTLQCNTDRSLLPDYIARYFDSRGILVVNKLLIEFYKCLNVILGQLALWSKFPHLYFHGIGYEIMGPSKLQLASTNQINHYKVNWHGKVYPDLYISMDIVAGFPFPGWLPPPWCRTHPLLEKNGCFVVAKRSEHAPEHLRDYLGRYSFSVSECDLMLMMPVALRKGYMLAKHMRHPRLCPVIQYEGKEDTPVNKVISSYMLKNCIFEEHAKLENMVEPSLERIIHYAQCIYIRLEIALSRTKLPMFFIPDQNLLSEKSEDEIQRAVDYCRLIRQLLRDPKCVEKNLTGLYRHKD